MKVSYAKHKDKVEFIGIACNDTEKKWKAAVEEHGLPWVQLINDENVNVSLMYAVSGYPLYYCPTCQKLSVSFHLLHN